MLENVVQRLTFKVYSHTIKVCDCWCQGQELDTVLRHQLKIFE